MLRRSIFTSCCLWSLVFLSGYPREHSDRPPVEPSQVAPTAQVAERVPQTLFHQPLPLQRVELASEALAVWRRYADLKPTLLLLSDIPMLLPVPAELRDRADHLAATASAEELYRQSYPKSPELLLLPEMTIDTVLRLGWLAELVWALPLRDSEQSLTLEPFRTQLLARGLTTAEETATLTGDARRIQGRLRDTPFRAATLANLGELGAPLLVHFDLSYFRSLYKNDVATPLLEIVIQTLGDLRELNLPVLAVTFSYGNLDERIALDVRFLGEILTWLTEHPPGFEQPVPLNFTRQGQILYLANFFQKEKIRELALAQELELPQAAWVKFNLFRAAAEHKDGTMALDYLARAVALDRVYALEYLELARFAHEKGRTDEALRMLQLASNALPEDPIIRLQMAQLAAEVGDQRRARTLVEALQSLPWTPVYFADLQTYFAGFQAYLATENPSAGAPKPDDSLHPPRPVQP